LEEKEVIESDWEAKEHRRPALRSAGDRIATCAQPGHEDEERLRRHAKMISDFMERVIRSHGIEELVLFAPGALLGRLRQALPARLTKYIKEQHGDFVHLPLAHLLTQPALLANLAR
jgi:protein required for attachment to host cells